MEVAGKIASATSARNPGAVTDRVLGLLRRHGWNATAFQTLERGFHYHFPDSHACVAYADTGAAWVAAGAPICAPRRFAGVVGSFAAAAARAGRRPLFFATEDRFVRRAGLDALLVGEQPVWDPARWDETLDTSPSLRAQLRRAQRAGVVARVVDAAELRDPRGNLRGRIERLIAHWLGTRPLAPMGFLVEVEPFFLLDERRYFIAEGSPGGELVAFLAAVPIYARGGWLFEDLFREPTAPNGSTEVLLDVAMRTVAREGSRFVTLGLAPLAGGVTGWLGLARRVSASLYDFGGLHAFRARLRPTRWDPIYVSFPRRRPALLAGTRAIVDVLTAFARGRLVRFGVETLLRGPAFVVRLLGLLLVPWTALLALAPARLFPTEGIRWAWVGFDLVLAGALLALATRWRHTLGTLVALAVSADAAVTAYEVLAYNLARATFADLAPLGVGCAAPILAAIILWNARGHRRRRWTRRTPP
jgi:phosphatidylglycerol lysyltransferase